MISLLSTVQIIDNSGGLIGRCIKILKPLRTHAHVGDLILISLLKTIPTGSQSKGSTPIRLQKGDVLKAIIVRTKSPDFNKIWDSNAVVLVKTAPKTLDLTPIGSRIKGPISSTLKHRVGCQKIISLAKFII